MDTNGPGATFAFTQLLIEDSSPTAFCADLATSAPTANGCGGFNGVSGASQGQIVSAFFNGSPDDGVPAATPESFSGAGSFFGFDSSDSFVSDTGTLSVQVYTPEPAGFVLAGIGLVALMFVRRRHLAFARR